MSMRIQDKTKEIEKYLAEFSGIIPSDIEEYKKSIKTKAACERYFEKIAEAITDLAFLIIKDKELRQPEDDKQSFDVLAEENIIQKSLAEKLKDLKGMRNIIAHGYGKIDDEIVFHSITEEMEKDVNEFILEIRKI
ncbi:MAG: DUF86 domain-containing protein [Candidatus Woesearchaeota archaeon]|nr:DUF86 domain-containing protein [Candidatus Woesearchaeota archaeon]